MGPSANRQNSRAGTDLVTRGHLRENRVRDLEEPLFLNFFAEPRAQRVRHRGSHGANEVEREFLEDGDDAAQRQVEPSALPVVAKAVAQGPPARSYRSRYHLRRDTDIQQYLVECVPMAISCQYAWGTSSKYQA